MESYRPPSGPPLTVFPTINILPEHDTSVTTEPILKSQSEMKSESHSVMSYSLRSHGLYSLWNSPGQCTGVGSLSLLQGIFPTQGLNPGLLHCRQILYQRSHKGSPILMHYYYLNPQLQLVLLFMFYSCVSFDKCGSHIHHYKPYRIVQRP